MMHTESDTQSDPFHGLLHDIHSRPQYPWLEHSSHAPTGDPAEWLTEVSEISLSSSLVSLSEENVQPLACAAWAMVLAQHTGSEETCFGKIARGHNHSHSAVKVLAIDCERTLTVSDLVMRVKSQLQPASNIISASCMSAGVVRNCLAFPNPKAVMEATNGEEHRLSPPNGCALILSVTLKDGYISVQAEFDSNVVAQAEIMRVLRQFSQAFQHVISHELQAVGIGDLSLLTLEDKTELHEWNAHNVATAPVNNLLHVLFQETAKANPEKPALRFCDETITYRDLDILSSGLARQILEADSSSSLGGYIPICIEKSPEMIIAMLAVLKAGKAFVPMDPIHAGARRDQILVSVQPKIILVSNDGQADLSRLDLGIKPLVVQRSVIPTGQTCQTIHSQEGINPTSPAYVLFTSGSTGTPKGVVVEHQNICTSMTELGRHFNLDSETRMLQYTSCSFDPSILEIFGTLIHGGSVCIPTETARLNNIPQAIENLGVNTAVFVPSVLKLLHPDQIPGVTKLIIGGEKLTHSLIDLWAEKKQVINAYGPTETCVCSLANLRVSVRSLGANIGNTAIACRAWVVNPHNERQLMPIGAVGELWIEGPTVARGYLNNAAATEASFVSSLPWANAECGTSTRAYRTGDLVRYLSNGELLFLGRKDKQVKLNGHRVELEEIEAAICRSPLVAHASVQLLSVGGSSVLAAFLVPQGSTRRQQAGDDDICKLLRLSEGDLGAHLRDGLREQLPAYMIPEYMIPVNFIPLMPSGKIDQHRLAEILAQARLLSRKHSSGDNETAKEKAQALPDSYKTMQSLWANALDIPSSTISPTDRFLHLGGNSIRAMKLVSAARDCGIRLTVGEVLKNHTVEEISRIARSKIVRAAAIPKSPVQIDTPRTAYIPTWIQMVSVTTVGAFPEGNYTRIVIDLRGSLDLARLREASRSLVEKNEILRTQYRLRNGTIEAIVLDKTEVDVPVVHFDSRSQAVKHWESVSPDGCLDRQLVEFSYVVMNANSTHFALGLQHSQYDAWTVPLLLSQLQRIYHGLPISSGPPFSVYAARLPLESNAAAEAFWKAQLANLPMTSLRNNGLNDGGDADKPDGHFQRTIRLLPSPFTFATTIYAAWALVLSKHANTKRVVFGGAVSGRNIDMEGILDVVGPCINMIPFTVDVAGVITYLDVLQAVRDALIATVPFEAMPMPDILSRCTDWDPMAAFGSIVQHLDISFDVPPLEGIESGEVGGPGMLKWKYLEVRKQYGRCRATDIYVCSSTATGDAGAADVQLKFNPSVISPELAGALFDELCGHISAALQSPAQDIRK